MSVPICLAARVLNLKLFLFEPNLVLGRANLFLLNYCEKIFTYSKKIKNLPNKMNHKNFVIQPLIRKKFFYLKKEIKKKKKKPISINNREVAKARENLIVYLMKI